MLAIPFSASEFRAVFTAYNAAVWPAQPILITLALLVAGLALRYPTHGRRVGLFLASLWAWSGVVYHFGHFSAINPAARLFGTLFLVQAALFLWWGAVRRRVVPEPADPLLRKAATAIIAYALVIYPLIGLLRGHAYMAGPSFGAPCPVAIYTFGLLLLAPRAPSWLLVIPVGWAIVGSTAFLSLGLLEDVGLPLAAILTLALRHGWYRHHRPFAPSPMH